MSAAAIALPELQSQPQNALTEQLPNTEQIQQHQQQQQQQQREITIESIEKELSVLAALPRPVRCRRVVPETAFAMLETVVNRLLNEAADAVEGATFSTAEQPGTKKQDAKQRPSVPAVTRPGSIVFLERADVWCDLLDEFSQTAELYGSNMPLTVEQLTALNSATVSSGQQAVAAAAEMDAASGGSGVLLGGGALVDGAGKLQEHETAAGGAAAAAAKKTRGPDSLAVNTAQTSERDSLSTPKQIRGGSPQQQQQHQPNKSPLSPSLSATGGLTTTAAGSPLRHSETLLHNLVAEHMADGNSSSSNSNSSQSSSPSRRSLLLKIQVKERLRDVFVKMSTELAATIKIPKSFFPPPAVEKAMRDLKAMQAEASKFAALTVELYSELEQQLAAQLQDVFGKARTLAGDKGWISSVSDRSRKDRTQRISMLVTDVYLMLAQLDSRRSDATISVCRALLSLAGLESRRSNHDSALQLATEAISKLGKLYAKEATTINEFRATASAEAMQQQMMMHVFEHDNNNSSSSQLGYGSVLASNSNLSTFHFLCQVHESFGHGFPAPLEHITPEQRDTMGNTIVALQRRLQQVIPLRVAAHFNRATELEHNGASATESRSEYTAALTAGSSPRLPDFALLPQHPLMVRVADALSSLVAAKMERSRAARFPASAGGGGGSRAASASGAPSSSSLPPLIAGRGTNNVPRPPSGQQQQQQRTARTPNAPVASFARVQNTGRTADGFSAAGNRSARMIGGSEFSKNLSSDEVSGARGSHVPPMWGAGGDPSTLGAEDKNLVMLKKFGIVPENMESMSKKKQVPISSVAHLDDNFIADPTAVMEAAAAAAAAQGTMPDGNGGVRTTRDVVEPLGMDSSLGRTAGRRGTISGGKDQQQQQLYQAQLDKQLEEKLSNRQSSMLSGVHGLMDARSSKTHARYDAELDSIIVRCKRAFTVRDQAARVIQRAWRCAVARLEAYNRRQVLYHFLFQAQKAAGTAILSTYRKHRQQQAFLQKRAGIRSKREMLAKEEVRRRKAAMTIARAIRKFKTQRLHEADLMRRLRIRERESLMRSDVAAAVIQRWWKLIKHEARYWRQRNEQLRKSKVEEAMALKYHAAATTVQRVFRGHLGRYDARVVKARVMERRMALRRSVNYAADTVRTLLLEWRARQNRLEMMQVQKAEKRETAQKTIRGGWYDALERRKMKIVRARAREVSLSARRLQCWWRCILAKRELRYKRKVTQTITMVRIRSEWSRLRAACVIQGAWRVHAAKRVLRSLRAGVGRELIHAIWDMQRVGRAFAVRRSLCAERALFEHLVRSAFAKATVFRNAQVVLVQRFMYPRTSQRLGREVLSRRLEEKVMVWRAMRGEQREDRRAQHFQALGRGFLVRRSIMPVLRREAHALAEKRDAAACRIQHGWRCGAARDELRRRKGSKARLLERQRVWAEVQAALHVDRVASLALMEQSTRQGVAKHQRELRREMLRAYFAPILFVSSSPAAVPSDETPTGTSVVAEQQQQQQRASSTSSSSSESAQRRILDMYDDSDEEQEKNEFVQCILNR